MTNLPQVPTALPSAAAATAQRVLDQAARGRSADSIEELVNGTWAKLSDASGQALAAYGRSLVAALRA